MNNLSASPANKNMSLNTQWPSISVVMPIRNEARYIERSLRAMLAQDYPGEMEVLCVDGMSQDGTREIIQQIASDDARVWLVDNPRQIIPAALNMGIRAARYEMVARMDGHTYAPPDYLRRCVELYEQTGADHVGGRIEYSGETFMARAIGAAMESPFGAGPARWRSTNAAAEVDTVPFGLWRRERMLALGAFDERLMCNEDYEFNYRLQADGGKVYYSPDITTVYYSRQTLLSLWQQYFRYGLWKARTVKMHPASFRTRHMFAPAFVIGLAGGAMFWWVAPIWRWVYALCLAFYAGMGIFFAIKQSARHGWRYFPLIPLIFLILHLAWGSGFLIGVWRWWIRQEDKHEARPSL